ncbi:hypothetical protein E2C01_038463 [Portunus trituberculatus]|uniref:Uncharacterized protein n=1 Tax=Portunus trituberculatus TaxID=210409 RepID=A0A5B7FI18_PORTR|nr:hypothetical protein [Portunus trituberculatus]
MVSNTADLEAESGHQAMSESCIVSSDSPISQGLVSAEYCPLPFFALPRSVPHCPAIGSSNG